MLDPIPLKWAGMRKRVQIGLFGEPRMNTNDDWDNLLRKWFLIFKYKHKSVNIYIWQRTINLKA